MYKRQVGCVWGGVPISLVTDLVIRIAKVAPVYLITTDQFQSWYTRQAWSDLGIPTEHLSVDKDASAYENLRDCVYERRIVPTYSPFLFRELRSLVRVPNKKVDHPFGASKDLSDAVAGAVFNITESMLAMPTPEPPRPPSSSWVPL